MPKKNFTEEQIAHVLRQAEAGVPMAELIRKTGITEQIRPKILWLMSRGEM